MYNVASIGISWYTEARMGRSASLQNVSDDKESEDESNARDPKRALNE